MGRPKKVLTSSSRRNIPLPPEYSVPCVSIESPDNQLFVSSPNYYVGDDVTSNNVAMGYRQVSSSPFHCQTQQHQLSPQFHSSQTLSPYSCDSGMESDASQASPMASPVSHSFSFGAPNVPSPMPATCATGAYNYSMYDVMPPVSQAPPYLKPGVRFGEGQGLGGSMQQGFASQQFIKSEPEDAFGFFRSDCCHNTRETLHTSNPNICQFIDVNCKNIKLEEAPLNSTAHIFDCDELNELLAQFDNNTVQPQTPAVAPAVTQCNFDESNQWVMTSTSRSFGQALPSLSSLVRSIAPSGAN